MPNPARALAPICAGTLLLLLTIPCRAADELIIVSPHWEGIQYEFDRAFREHYLQTTGRPVTLRWRDLGGTSSIEKAIDAAYAATPASCQMDVFFGGGIDPFESQKAKGHFQPHRLPDALLASIPRTVGGFPLVDPDFLFYGAALSSFGILENRRVTARASLPPVATWEDLCDPRLRGWVSSADPRKSGSIHMIYEIILQAYGWEKGWDVILRMSGNVRSFLQNSSAPTKEVSAGDAAYAITIDINGMTQQAFLGKDNVRFTIPAGLSVINPDGIAILKGAPHLPAARAFVDFVMSPGGQRLWMTPTGQPGGAVKFGITRMGVLPDLYQADLSQLLVPLNPFAIDYPFQYDSAAGSSRWNVVNDLIGQTVIDVHPHLVDAWTALQSAPPAARAVLLEEFSRPPITEAGAAVCAAYWRKDKIRARATANQWMIDAVARFRNLAARSSNPALPKDYAGSFQPSSTRNSEFVIRNSP